MYVDDDNKDISYLITRMKVKADLIETFKLGRRYSSGIPMNNIFLFVGDDSRRIKFCLFVDDF